MINLPIGLDIINLIDDIRPFSWEAANIFRYYSKALEDSNNKRNILTNKNRHDPVTLADLKVNDLIIKRINKNYKEIDWDILSEENVKTGSDDLLDINSKWMWVLDPLDGTKDFIQGTANYAMHLALNYEKKPCIGLVLIPDRGELWISDSKDTWCEKKDGLIRKASLQKNKPLREMTIVTSKNHRNESLQKLIKKINFKEEVIMGSIGCKIASILRLLN